MVSAPVVPCPWERRREIARERQDAARRARPDAEPGSGALERCMTVKALALELKAAGRELSRAGPVQTLETAFDLDGLKVRYSPSRHEGARFVDLTMASREGRFIH